MKTATELILQKLQDTFDEDGNILEDPHSSGNVWLMLAAIIPFGDKEEMRPLLPYGVQLPSKSSNDTIPTHIARVVLRTSDAQQGTNEYVDGTDFCFVVDETNQAADFVWEEESFGDAPKFHGGDIQSAIEWLRAVGDPVYRQFKDPFLMPEQRIALNGHDEDFITPNPAPTSTTGSPDDIENFL